MQNILENIYYKTNTGFCSAREVWLRAKCIDGSITLKNVKDWLSTQETYALHKPARRLYPRNKVLISAIDEQWQADLADLGSLSKFNDNFKFLLTCIDVFSKFAWAKPVKNKTACSISEAFEHILKSSGRSPQKLQTDAGTEFLNKSFQSMLKKYNIAHFSTNSELKASVVERFNRTLKSRMWRYFTQNNAYRYVDELPNLLLAYNTSQHRTIGMAPCDVSKKNETQILQKCYRKKSISPTSFKFKIGDDVRINKCKQIFEKGYTPNWSIEIFKIEKCLSRDPPVYKIKDELGETIQGIFYEYELQKVDDSKKEKVYLVEKVLKTRYKNGKKEHLVKWKGYPAKFNSWVQHLIKL
jgi:Integrase core domain/Chromo (CHRromatin Organisation MOdifier) domain